VTYDFDLNQFLNDFDFLLTLTIVSHLEHVAMRNVYARQ